jgi:hypothetical protein
LRTNGSTKLISIAGLRARLAIVPGERMSAKKTCSSSSTCMVALGERLGVPSAFTVATKPSFCSAITRFMSGVRVVMGASDLRRAAAAMYDR